MIKYQTILILITALIFAACFPQKSSATNAENENLNYVGSKFQNNYIWGRAMNFAWNELIENYTDESIEHVTKDEAALKTLHCFNNPVFTITAIDEASYYAKSRYGLKKVALCNQECGAKFSAKSIVDLQLKLADRDNISYAYFLKQIEYEIALKKQAINFLDKKVKGFTSDSESYSNVYIVDYENDDNFVLMSILKHN
ncbi:MAG: hypothetical protein BWX76_00366 [Candidatus Cloacimonetes bacterium ADurb.Bin089]|nr:MAG: hypothetical protein BWX76_00366 [Candidatus Cloacimonetes bacterium ADurb.Bin089]